MVVTAKQKALLNANEEDLFGGGDIYSTGAGGSGTISQVEALIKTQTTITRTIDYDTAAFNYVSILLKPGENLNASVAKLKQVMKDNNLPVKVLTWKTASGQMVVTIIGPAGCFAGVQAGVLPREQLGERN
jgi:hypothetical protein